MRLSSIYVCQSCGFESPKWSGQCPSCGKWNSFAETVVSAKGSKLKAKSLKLRREETKPLRLDQVESLQFSRQQTSISELDRVLGGGIVPGSVVLMAGEPGMGKSTLLTQLALQLARAKGQKLKAKSQNSEAVFYVCGEESPSQVKLRIERLALSLKHSALSQNLYLLPETNVENIIASLERQKPSLVIIDSIQTVWTESLSGMSGSVGQIRESANLLAEYAKINNIAVFLVGHVTKEGAIAGPKVLEHMVDTVLYLEGDKNHEFRILRAVKNRFGPTDEVGVFVMSEKGMEEVSNPSEAFIQSQKSIGSGSCKVVTMQGLRPMLVEIQALTVKSKIPVPRRVGRGIDSTRLQILCAVLQKKAGINLFDSDVYLNVSGGLKLPEPAVDFGICLSIASSYKNKTIAEKSVVIGEVGLLGEIRRVNFLDKRIKQAKALGYDRIIGPEQFGSLREAVGKILK